jgi:hypothetical protein
METDMQQMSHKTIGLAGLVVATLLIVSALAGGTGGGAQAAPKTTPTLAAVSDPEFGEFDPASVADIDLADYPLIPEIGEQARLVYLDGLQQGNDPHAFIKVGDCMTDNPFFLIPIGDGDYALGDYESLQTVIDHFITDEHNAFSRKSQAALGGFNAASVLDSLWANPEFCEAGETPLSCEFRHMQPSIALIMFGTNDTFSLDEAQFDYFLRSIVVETIRNGTLPILSTFPVRPEFLDKSDLFNKIVVRVALDYDMPLINLWHALEPLPNQGVNPEETTHMTTPTDERVCYFIDANMQAGFTVRNLLTLQTLDAVLQAVNVEE